VRRATTLRVVWRMPSTTPSANAVFPIRTQSLPGAVPDALREAIARHASALTWREFIEQVEMQLEGLTDEPTLIPLAAVSRAARASLRGPSCIREEVHSFGC
jgi:hypothetical protein